MSRERRVEEIRVEEILFRLTAERNQTGAKTGNERDGLAPPCTRPRRSRVPSLLWAWHPARARTGRNPQGTCRHPQRRDPVGTLLVFGHDEGKEERGRPMTGADRDYPERVNVRLPDASSCLTSVAAPEPLTRLSPKVNVRLTCGDVWLINLGLTSSPPSIAHLCDCVREVSTTVYAREPEPHGSQLFNPEQSTWTEVPGLWQRYSPRSPMRDSTCRGRRNVAIRIAMALEP